MKRDQEFRDWAIQQCVPVFYGSSFLIVFFVNTFHWIMPLISDGVYDSLPTRLWASLPGLVFPICVLAVPTLKKYVLEFQAIQISAMAVGCVWVTGLAQFHPYYLTASLLGIIGAALSLVTMAQVWCLFVVGVGATTLLYFVLENNTTFFPFLYYYSFMVISCLLAWIKVRAHAQEFRLRRSLHVAIEDLKLEKSKSFFQEQLSFVGQLAGNLAHEVNTPLTIFHTSLQLLREKLQEVRALDSESETLIKKCFDQSQRIKSLVDNLLYFSGKHFQAESRQSARQLIESAVSLVKNYSDQKNVKIKLEIESEEVHLACSNRDVLQILFHTLKNGIEAASQLPKAIDIWVKVETHFSSAQREYEILVVDSGNGVPSDLVGQLFTPFVVGKEKKGHIGLGLSTCRSIMERCGGKVEFIEGLSHTTFRIAIPVHKNA